MKFNLPTALLSAVIVTLSVPAVRAAPPTMQSTAAQRATPAQVTSRQLARMRVRMRALQEQMHRIRRTNLPQEKDRLLHEHMQGMLMEMQAMRAMGGSLMRGMMRGRMGRGTMMGRSSMGGGTMGGGSMRGGAMGGGMMGGTGPRARHRAMRTQGWQWMQDRMDMMQMMMEQMMQQLEAMQHRGPRSGGK